VKTHHIRRHNLFHQENTLSMTLYNEYTPNNPPVIHHAKTLIVSTRQGICDVKHSLSTTIY
ncbi:MAG: hypothetical protein WBQ73_03155, partial [Candidatus Babeliales bacterium]